MSSDPYSDYMEMMKGVITISQAAREIFKTLPKCPAVHPGRRSKYEPRKYLARFNDDRILDGQYIGSCDRK